MIRHWLITGWILCVLTVVPSAEQAAADPQAGGSLVMAISKRMKLMNPLVRTSSTERRIRELMFEPLLGLDLKGNVQPHLAESWDISSDGKLYTFQLRKGVKFHDGRELTAEDIKFAMDYTMDPKNGAYGYQDLSLVERVEAADRHVLKVHMKGPNPVFLATLTEIRAFSAIPKDSLPEGVRRPKQFPAGTGPFKFVEWEPGQRIVFERFEDYWGHKAWVDRVTLRIISDASVRFTALQAGDVDIVERTPYQWVQQIVSGKISGIGYTKASLAGARAIEFNVADAPFDNPKLRAAVAHAIDRNEILTAAYLGLAEPTDQRFPKEHVWYFDDAPKYSYDLEKAKRLLKESGYNGETIELMGNRGEVAEIEGAAIQSQLKKIGMNVKLLILERASNLDRRRKGEYAFKLAGGSYYADPLLAYNEFKCEKSLKKRRVNESGYCSAEYDALLKRAETEVDGEKRRRLFKKIVGKLFGDLPILSVGFTPRFFTFKKAVNGFVTDHNGSFVWWGGGLHHAWVKK